MSRNTKTLKQLLSENEDLRARLEEAEETLSAIRNGEVDALVVLTEKGDQIFTLKSAEQPYRMLIEETHGAFTVTEEGAILYANRRLAEILKTPLEKVIGASILNFIEPTGRQAFSGLLQQGKEKRVHGEFCLNTGDGLRLAAYFFLSRIPGSDISRFFCLVAID